MAHQLMRRHQHHALQSHQEQHQRYGNRCGKIHIE